MGASYGIYGFDEVVDFGVGARAAATAATLDAEPVIECLDGRTANRPGSHFAA